MANRSFAAKEERVGNSADGRIIGLDGGRPPHRARIRVLKGRDPKRVRLCRSVSFTPYLVRGRNLNNKNKATLSLGIQEPRGTDHTNDPPGFSLDRSHSARRMRVDTTWREFWDRDRTTYVSERHRRLESQLIGHAVETFIPNRTAVILDYGCGDNHVADEVALSCRKLILCDSAPLLLERLKQRFLKSDGLLVIGDVIPNNANDVRDAITLLRFGWEGGFLFAAIVGLLRIWLSDYRKIRRVHGIFKYDEASFIAIFRKAGFVMKRCIPNIGHNQSRMTFTGRPAE